jgi:hypothetical protein
VGWPFASKSLCAFSRWQLTQANCGTARPDIEQAAPRSAMSAARSTVHELGGLWGVLAFSLFLLGVPARLGLKFARQ